MHWSQFMPIWGTRLLRTKQRGHRNKPKLLIVANIALNICEYNAATNRQKSSLLFIICRVKKEPEEPTTQNIVPTFDASKVLVGFGKRAS